ncbi:MAG: hypothetical protein BWY42_01257 [Candidatus Omnitrophica bacterium ADurb.Bin277]|nr:MAG: hypothetical protein BWY42_01257 [Candidatus Omnitrophica bacterium ADurb.Bin277]
MEKKTEIAVKEETALAQSTGRGRGFEEPTAKEDLIIPRAKLFQGLPSEYDKYPDAKPGQILNSITKELLPSEFIPIFKFTNWVRFNPRNKEDRGFDPNAAPGAVIWRTNDPHDPRVEAEGKFGPNGEPPLATKFLNFFSVFPGCPMPVVVSFSKTSFKAGKQLLSIAQFSGGDMFGKKYALGSKKESGDSGSYYVLTVTPSGIVDGDLFKQAERLFDEFATKPIKVDEEHVADEEPAPF